MNEETEKEKAILELETVIEKIRKVQSEAPEPGMSEEEIDVMFGRAAEAGMLGLLRKQ